MEIFERITVAGIGNYLVYFIKNNRTKSTMVFKLGKKPDLDREFSINRNLGITNVLYKVREPKVLDRHRDYTNIHVKLSIRTPLTVRNPKIGRSPLEIIMKS
jgi:hypothetical protein